MTITRILILVAMQVEADPIILQLKMDPLNKDSKDAEVSSTKDKVDDFKFEGLPGTKNYIAKRKKEDYGLDYEIILTVFGECPEHHADLLGEAQAAGVTAATVIALRNVGWYPTAIVNPGSAGACIAQNARIGAVYIITKSLYTTKQVVGFKGLDQCVLSHSSGILDISAIFPEIFAAAEREKIEVDTGTLGTGGAMPALVFQLERLADSKAIGEDMEANAVVDMGRRLDIPVLPLKVMVNFINAEASNDFKNYIHIVLSNLAMVVDLTITKIAGKTPTQLKSNNPFLQAKDLRASVRGEVSTLPAVTASNALTNVATTDSSDFICLQRSVLVAAVKKTEPLTNSSLDAKSEEIPLKDKVCLKAILIYFYGVDVTITDDKAALFFSNDAVVSFKSQTIRTKSTQSDVITTITDWKEFLVELKSYAENPPSDRCDARSQLTADEIRLLGTPDTQWSEISKSIDKIAHIRGVQFSRVVNPNQVARLQLP